MTDLEMLVELLSQLKQTFHLNVQPYRFVRTVPAETEPPFSLRGIPGRHTNITFTCNLANIEFVFNERDSVVRVDMSPEVSSLLGGNKKGS